MEENKKLTPEEIAKKEARKAAKKIRKESRNGALTILKELVDKQPDKKFQEALKTVRPSLYGIVREKSAGSGGTSVFNKFVALVAEKKTVSEDEIFKQFKVGRKDCAGFLRKHLKRTEPEARIWINFDKEKGVYTFAGKGAVEPSNYTGPKPSTESVNLK